MSVLEQPIRMDTASPILFVVEGKNDIAFLKRMSRILHGHDPLLPDLGVLEEQGRIIFVPFGGGNLLDWTSRLAPLGLPELHLYDCEVPPETQLRREAAEAVNARGHCQAVLTLKRSMENYLHADAILAIENIRVEFDDFDPVADIVAKAIYKRDVDGVAWELLPRRSRKRQINRIKGRLNTTAVEAMTFDMLNERDPDGEIVSWLVAIRELLKQG
jgi:hypothetical protein